MIGKITRVPLRDVWKHEALGFTSWLVENTDALPGVLGLTLQKPEKEHATGDFSADLVAEDDGGNVVVIENQLEKCDHDHLGKLLTYIACQCRVRYEQEVGGYRDNEDKWPDIQDAMIDAMTRLEKTLGPFIQAIQ